MAEDWYKKLELAAKQNPHFQALSEYLDNLPIQPGSFGAALPFYRVEVPKRFPSSKGGMGPPVPGKWEGYFAGHPLDYIRNALNKIYFGATIKSPGPVFRALTDYEQKHGRFLFTENVGTPEVIAQIIQLAREHPEEVRLLRFPEKVIKHSLYSDPDQIFINLRKMLRYGKEMK